MNHQLVSSGWAKVKIFARMVKIEHSIFALPFAYVGLFLAAQGWPGLRQLLLITLAMVTIRSWAMAVNRAADISFDSRNPRTRNRPLVTGEIVLWQVYLICGLNAAVFILTCAFFNWLCLLLSPVALLWSALYSLSKRFTWLSHYWLGSVLGLAPLGGWLAYKPYFSWTAIYFFLAVTFWVAGFDILYASQDADFDRRVGLKSLPARFGIKAALMYSTITHALAALFFFAAGWVSGLGHIYFFLWLVISSLLLWQHRLVSPDDLRRVNLAFFNANAMVAVVLCLGVLLDLFL